MKTQIGKMFWMACILAMCLLDLPLLDCASIQRNFQKISDKKSTGAPINTFSFTDPGVCQVIMNCLSISIVYFYLPIVNLLLFIWIQPWWLGGRVVEVELSSLCFGSSIYVTTLPIL